MFVRAHHVHPSHGAVLKPLGSICQARDGSTASPLLYLGSMVREIVLRKFLVVSVGQALCEHCDKL
jgi:hypothetical protein